MARKNRAGNRNKRPGSKCCHKMMTPKQKAKRNRIYLWNTRQQSNIKRLKVERQQQLEFAA